MLRPKAILETVLYVNDLDVTAAFYRKLLQLETVHSDERMYALRVSDENFLLLFKAGATTEPITLNGGIIPPHDGTGPMHVALSIDQNDVGSWVQRLQTNDVPIESTVHWPSGEESLYFRDPDGHLVELATPNIWKN